MKAERLAVMVLVLAMHALAAAAVLTHAPARSALLAAAPIMVELINAPTAAVQPAPPHLTPAPVTPPAKPKLKPVRVAKAKAPQPLAPPPPVEVPPAPQIAPAPPAPLASVPPPPAPSAPAPAPVIEMTPPVFNANYLENPAPRYPSLSRRIGEQGRVILRVLVDPAGSAREIEVRASSGHARLDDAARDAVRQWRFVPARRGQEPVAAWVLVPVSFRLDG